MNAITIVLRSGMGMQIDSVRPYLRNGMPIAIGRAGAVISHFADGDAHLALRTIAEYPCPKQDNLPAANMRQIALAALSGAGASSVPGNPGREPVSGPGNAGERPHPAPGSGDSELAESLQTLVRWLDRVAIEDGYVGVPVIEAVEVVVTELKRQQQVNHPVACRYGHWFAGDSDEAAFVRERGICRDCADVDEQITGQVLLKPCSFCGGPPKPIVTHAEYPFGAAPRMSDYGDDGLWVEACVFCHECGAQGPALQRNISDASDYDSVLEDAVDLWQNRDERHAELYQAGHAEGLNQFPRPDIEPAPQVLCAGVDVAADRVELAIHNWTAPAEGGDA
ncbi:TPA: Lar family restriction alleviation protein [Pseudomonas aeruginosa]|uniref:Lar family restriction alleviation protein n=1 Tax=Pseudomonas aeruginosa TaxID=287 RepID=UPI001571D52A|nr:Lar family restriction alleviation protein [Pseudomonas aeruginosa]NTT93910.1 Lar family restriction alleviation protein [Pseudomonas aeruginosa]HCF3158030.1 Lar family restriction alleviation protein [Pseudomonas aeruginosa]HDR2972464.1 Lar family restriction alleviation protein [Pseudomonas aeruginosa]